MEDIMRCLTVWLEALGYNLQKWLDEKNELLIWELRILKVFGDGKHNPLNDGDLYEANDLCEGFLYKFAYNFENAGPFKMIYIVYLGV